QGAEYGPESSPTVTSPPELNVGASFTGVTSMLKVTGADVSSPPVGVPPSSISTMVMLALPLASGAGVKVRLPVAALIAGGTENSAGLLLAVTSNVRLWPASLPGPAETFVA